MMLRKVCIHCSHEIEKDRLAVLETDVCASCAKKLPGNILNTPPEPPPKKDEEDNVTH
jgi:hypothetical protein